jgi:hypothetical protein
MLLMQVANSLHSSVCWAHSSMSGRRVWECRGCAWEPPNGPKQSPSYTKFIVCVRQAASVRVACAEQIRLTDSQIAKQAHLCS